MKKITFLVLLLINLSGYSQSVLEDFEGNAPTIAITNDDNGSVSIVADPEAGGTRGNVLKLVTASGQSWTQAELVLQGDHIDLTATSTQRTVEVDVYSTTARTFMAKVVAGTGDDSAGNSTAAHAGAGWETITFDFTVGQDNTAAADGIYGQIFFFPFRDTANNAWHPADNSEFYFDNIKAIGAPAPTLPSFPFDFETSSIGFGSWGSAGFAQITNPDPSGINTSSNVGEFTHDGTGGYVGIESDGTFDNIDFTATPTFKVKVWVDEPVEVIFKLQNNPTYQENSEKKYQVSQEETSKWIQLEFNFSDVTATNYNRVVLYFDGGNSIPSGAGHKYYFDDIEKSSEVADPTCTDGVQNGDETGVDCGGSSCNECPALLSEFNFDFDTPTSITSYNLDFNENAINTVTDGINPTLNVGELTGVNNDWWSQIKVEDANGIDLSGGDRGISLKVKGPRALPVTIKIESGGDEHAVTVNYNTVDIWQELLFDFTSFNSTNNTKIAVFFDMQVNGDVVTDPTLNIFQIDDFAFGNFNTLSSDIFEIEGLVTFPNPTNNSWNISNKNQVITSIEVFNVLGKKVISMQPNTISAEVDASNLTTGLYISKIATKLGTVTRKLIKQ